MLPLKTGPGHSCYVVAAIAKRLRGFFHGFVQSRRDSVKQRAVSFRWERSKTATTAGEGTCLYEYLPILRVHRNAEDSQPYMSAGCRSKMLR